jgi:hypothetical protein
MRGVEILLHLATVALSAAGLILGIRTDLWGVVGNDPLHVGFASLGLAVLLLLIGERVAFGARLRDTERMIASEITGLLASISSGSRIVRFTTCDEALVALADRLSGTAVILNTRISRDGVQSGHVAHTKYHRALEAALNEGAKMVDIVTPAFEDEARRLQGFAQKPRGKGEYTYHLLRSEVSCFLNFTVLEYPTGDPEVWIGWATSSAHGMEQPAFRIVSKDLVTYFRAYHAALRAR